MVSLSSRFLALAAFCSYALGAPWPVDSKHATHRARELPNGVKVQMFHPQSDFEVFGDGIDHPLSARAEPPTMHEAATAFLESRLGKGSLAVRSSFAGQVADHVFVNQQFHGIPVSNAVANVALNKAGRVVSFGSSFVKPSAAPPAPAPKLGEADAIAAAAKQLDGVPEKDEAPLEFLALDDGSVVLTRSVQLELNGNGHLVEAFVDAQTGAVRAMNDFTTSLTMLVLPIQKETTAEGFETLVNPEDPISSPDGWTTVGGVDSGTTTGNNAISFKNVTHVSTESAPGEFIFPLDEGQDPTVASNVDAARANTFYIVNTIHDITYRYGFTEAAFNFQQDNFGKGGKGNDRVTISVQDTAGLNNADFSTPADGSSGRMRMFLWTHTTPFERDGAVENDIIAHENTHGLSNRLTGGGTGRCLQTTEAGGMGEGWSDAFAEWSEHKDATIPDYGVGTYVFNTTLGLRTHLYSTDTTVNPLTYADIQVRNEVHAIGEIWANLLHNVYAALLGVHGFIGDAKTNPDSTDAQAVFLHLFIDALALQPCNPTFLTARLAWIQADANRFGGANFCTLWNAFASKGLGVNAANHVNNFDVPAGC
ncbi:putative extracellular elastinolytic metallo proteinase precursor [Exidia glandulosa HHB12029]|uniref:Extracellular metalloproteinase n=1 Tax=Exidia glandulosa HHB12029 TaxID=1314781 RepID=A0A165Q4V4_EXIGL|nr:putative extracellular elastinolytic metallo proteinase precursor [Exidia glandulosa HHB12029]